MISYPVAGGRLCCKSGGHHGLGARHLRKGGTSTLIFGAPHHSSFTSSSPPPTTTQVIISPLLLLLLPPAIHSLQIHIRTQPLPLTANWCVVRLISTSVNGQQRWWLSPHCQWRPALHRIKRREPDCKSCYPLFVDCCFSSSCCCRSVVAVVVIIVVSVAHIDRRRQVLLSSILAPLVVTIFPPPPFTRLIVVCCVAVVMAAGNDEPPQTTYVIHCLQCGSLCPGPACINCVIATIIIGVSLQLRNHHLWPPQPLL